MTTVYLINVGANSSHASSARSPLFADDRFTYVSFPTRTTKGTQPYSAAARPFVRNPDQWMTHADPDWSDLTYGDYCANPRAGALKKAKEGDILLFWGLLWANRGKDWNGFTGERDWFLLGAIRISEILRGGENLSALSKNARVRARRNAHLNGSSRLPDDHYVFVGDPERSRVFRHAVQLGTSQADGLIYRAFTSAAGAALVKDGSPAWKSSLRSCRPMWKLSEPDSRIRADAVSEEILLRNDFDLLQGI